MAILAWMAAATLIGAAAGAAEGQDEQLDLTWRAPPGCPSGAGVKAEVRRLLGGRMDAASKPIRVAASVTALKAPGGGFRVRIETPGQQGAKRGRELHGASCAAVADATALVIALMIDPSAAAAAPAKPAESAPAAGAQSPGAAGSEADRPSPPAGPGAAGSAPPSASAVLPAPPSASAVQPTPPAASARTASPRPSAPKPSASRRNPARPREPPPPPGPRIAFGARAYAVGDIGALAGFSPGLGGALAMIYGRWRFEAGLSFWPYRQVFSPDLSTAGVRVNLLAPSLGSCVELPVGSVRVAPCAHLELASMHAKSFGVTRNGDGSHFWLGGRLGPMLLWSPLRWLDLTAELGVVVAPIRPRFTIENVGVVHQPSLFGLRLALGAGVRF